MDATPSLAPAVGGESGSAPVVAVVRYVVPPAELGSPAPAGGWPEATPPGVVTRATPARPRAGTAADRSASAAGASACDDGAVADAGAGDEGGAGDDEAESDEVSADPGAASPAAGAEALPVGGSGSAVAVGAGAGPTGPAGTSCSVIVASAPRSQPDPYRRTGSA
ncbi:hypothetical protein ACFFMR_29770 [Micromonospora andamanensis]|uniref:Uncharacterized protein n=1 Tax=Micromonospora andamanensis TaxID=1287068 RepID=A0ABQ4HRQ3_9ACTN|nr:hypothetical protein [Micromonospora andamanensis]GIJ08318.1 hypothetical protein Van01_15320 [Micromonospora andamanensis]